MYDFLDRNQPFLIALVLVVVLGGGALLERSGGSSGGVLGAGAPAKRQPTAAEKAGLAAANRYNALAMRGASVTEQRAKLQRELTGLGIPAETAARISRDGRPAAMLTGTSARRTSHLGGTAVLPQGASWPRTGKGRPLSFIGAFDLDALPAVPGLPHAGLLAVYEDFDVDMKETDPWKASRMFLIASSEQAVETKDPPDMDEYESFDRYDLEGHIQLLPATAEPILAAIPKRGQKKVIDAMNHFTAGILSGQQLGGVARPVQQEPTLMTDYNLSQSSAANRARFRADEIQPTDWRLIVQVNGTEDMMFGDGGSLYCMAPSKDLAKGDVSRGYCYWDSA